MIREVRQQYRCRYVTDDLTGKNRCDHFVAAYYVRKNILYCLNSSDVTHEDEEECEGEQQAVVRISEVLSIQEEDCSDYNSKNQIVVEYLHYREYAQHEENAVEHDSATILTLDFGVQHMCLGK